MTKKKKLQPSSEGSMGFLQSYLTFGFSGLWKAAAVVGGIFFYRAASDWYDQHLAADKNPELRGNKEI